MPQTFDLNHERRVLLKTVKLCHKVMGQRTVLPFTRTRLFLCVCGHVDLLTLQWKWRSHVVDVTNRLHFPPFEVTLPFLSVGTSGLAPSDSFPPWISMLELSPRGDLGLLGWRDGCPLPLLACKKINDLLQ